jgi:hypothetical protein
MKTRLLKLITDVANPGKIDKRQKYDWRRHPTWKAGQLFELDEEEIELPGTEGKKATMRVLHARGNYRNVTERNDPEVWSALMAALRPVEDPATRAQALVQNRSAWSLAQRLIDAGLIDADDILNVYGEKVG